MKKFQRFCTLFLLMIGLCSFALHAQSYAGLWRQVEQAQKKSLPQTVVKLTEKIYRKAELEKMLHKCSRHISVGRPIRKD